MKIFVSTLGDIEVGILPDAAVIEWNLNPDRLSKEVKEEIRSGFRDLFYNLTRFEPTVRFEDELQKEE